MELCIGIVAIVLALCIPIVSFLGRSTVSNKLSIEMREMSLKLEQANKAVDECKDLIHRLRDDFKDSNHRIAEQLRDTREYADRSISRLHRTPSREDG